MIVNTPHSSFVFFCALVTGVTGVSDFNIDLNIDLYDIWILATNSHCVCR